jgi:hypothetical protein
MQTCWATNIGPTITIIPGEDQERETVLSGHTVLTSNAEAPSVLADRDHLEPEPWFGRHLREAVGGIRQAWRETHPH